MGFLYLERLFLQLVSHYESNPDVICVLVTGLGNRHTEYPKSVLETNLL